VNVLSSVDSRIRTVRLDSVKSKPFIVVDVGLSERIPLSQAGQGIYRLVSIFSELLGNKPKVCLIDEIENGIHYSVLSQIWSGIAEVAQRLDIQIFATTHSWECLVAANEVFAARASYDFRVVQLYRLNGEISGRVLDRKHIEAAISGEIELR
jgi:AAA15 family ATPase/GTPase